jgi:hypothetical protein
MEKLFGLKDLLNHASLLSSLIVPKDGSMMSDAR